MTVKELIEKLNRMPHNDQDAQVYFAELETMGWVIASTLPSRTSLTNRLKGSDWGLQNIGLLVLSWIWLKRLGRSPEEEAEKAKRLRRSLNGYCDGRIIDGGSSFAVQNGNMKYRVLLQTLARSQNSVKIGTVARGADRWTRSKMSSEAVISRPT